jgi:hypothetical protein
MFVILSMVVFPSLKHIAATGRAIGFFCPDIDFEEAAI